MKRAFTPFVLLLLIYTGTLRAQSTYQQVYSIFQTKCTPACHSGGSPSGNLDLSGTEAAVYNRIVNVAPTNPSATGKGYKLIDPSYPFRSFLFRKVNHGLESQISLDLTEGGDMPNYSTALTQAERELIRQWIIWGAKDTGVAYNSNLIADYYNGQGIAEMPAPPTPAQEGKEGFQAKFGPIFLEPHGEFELFQLYDPKLQEDKEVNVMRSILPTMAHHWVLRSVDAGGTAAFGKAPIDGTTINAQILVYQYTNFMGIWQFADELNLPDGTAYFLDSAEAILLNLHMANYSADSIVAATAYVNIYTQPGGSGAIEMKTGLSPYGGMNPFLLQVPNTGTPYTLQTHITSPGETRYFWNMQSHTHSRGTDYDIFLRNSDGTKGTQIYEGFYNEDYTYNKGYYDYAHPAVRTFNPLLQVDMANGIIAEATWVNSGPDTIPFGLTTKDEMFVTYYSYTSQLPTDVKAVEPDELGFALYPNPAKSRVAVKYKLEETDEVYVSIYNSSGEKVKDVRTGTQPRGEHSISINISEEPLPAGMYFVKIATSNLATTRKLIIAD